tara:strand:- start:815 stop:1723 length:909 start_codon:yes stop_codon:yes gene_type:complete
MLDGTYRKKFSYPRVQVKILNEQIYIIGIKEGVEPVLSIPDKIKELDFGNITFTINDFEEETLEQQFALSGTAVKYSFLTSWAALNHVTGKKYRSIPFKKKKSYLNKLLGTNLIFLAKEMGISIDRGIYTKVKISNLHPKSIDDNKWKSFKGDFKTNIILPNYIGLGNGITRGYGTISRLFDIDTVVFDKELDKEETKDMDLVLPSDLIKKRKKTKDKKSIENRLRKEKSFKSVKKRRNKYSPEPKNNYYKKNRNYAKSKRILSEDFDVVVDGNIITPEKESDVQDDQRFNTEKYHKQQHKF